MEEDIAGSLRDLVVPLLLETSDGYKPLVAKRRFMLSAALLAKQAYWLVWFETLEKMDGKLAAVRFRTNRKHWSEPIAEPEWVAGREPTAREVSGFAAAAKRAASKLHGSKMPDEAQLLSMSFGVARNAVDDRVDSSSKDAVMARVLGPQLNAYRMSRAERGELEELLWESGEPAPAQVAKARRRL